MAEWLRSRIKIWSYVSEPSVISHFYNTYNVLGTLHGSESVEDQQDIPSLVGLGMVDANTPKG